MSAQAPYYNGQAPYRNDMQYPPPSNTTLPIYDNNSTFKHEDGMGPPRIGRTPSPTPSEEEALSVRGAVNWRPFLNWRFWIRKEWIWYYVIAALIIGIVAFFSFYDKQIVHFLQPTALKIRDLPVGWLIPIGIFFIISFPPLFGQEILAIICGVVWGLWIGFAIVAAGTFIGEIGNFYAFKYIFSKKSGELQKKSIYAACFARIVRDGGFRVALISRLSIVPGHLTTAVYATCGMSIWVFAIAAFLSLPKQFITVYLGVILDSSGTGTETPQERAISYGVFAVTGLVTVFAMWYIMREMAKVKLDVIYQRRKARQIELGSDNPYPNPSFASTTSVGFNPRASDSDIPLTASHQQWDAQGRAVGFSGDPQLHAPQPKRISGLQGRPPSYRTDGGMGYNPSGQRYPDDGYMRRKSVDITDPQTAVPRIPPPPSSGGGGAPGQRPPSRTGTSPFMQSRNPYSTASPPHSPTQSQSRNPYTPSSSPPARNPYAMASPPPSRNPYTASPPPGSRNPYNASPQPTGPGRQPYAGYVPPVAPQMGAYQSNPIASPPQSAQLYAYSQPQGQPPPQQQYASSRPLSFSQPLPSPAFPTTPQGAIYHPAAAQPLPSMTLTSASGAPTLAMPPLPSPMNAAPFAAMQQHGGHGLEPSFVSHASEGSGETVFYDAHSRSGTEVGPHGASPPPGYDRR